MAKTRKQFDYYSFDKILSRNAVYNCISGARGIGKTYGAKKFVIKNAIKAGEQFIYVRRYRSELKGRTTFFADIAHEFPDWEFNSDGAEAKMRRANDKDAKWETIGYFVALSTSQANKSIAYPRVTTIIFDEYIIEKGSLHYLPNEVNVFNDFYSTVDRYQDRTRVLMLSNAVSIMNPYFIEWNIMPDKEFVIRGDGFVACHFPDSDKFAAQVRKTRFGKFITSEAGTYADYAIDNEFRDNDDEFIQKKTGKAGYYCTINTKRGAFSVWLDSPLWFIQEKLPKDQFRYTLMPDAMQEGEILLSYSDKVMTYMRAAFKQGRLFFDTPKARNAFREIFVR